MVCGTRLRLCACGRARLGALRRRIRIHGCRRAGGLCRADRLDRATTLVQRPRRRHRPVLLRHGAMADGDARPARPRLHRALRRARRPVPLLQLSRRHFLRLPFVLVRQPARRQSTSPRRCRGAPADASRSGRRHHRAHPRRRLVARALRLRKARADQGAGAVDRALGQDGPAPARQHPRLRGSEGAQEARRHRRQERARGAPPIRSGRIPPQGAAAVLRSAPQGVGQRIHGRRAGAPVHPRRRCLARRAAMAARARDLCSLFPAPGTFRQRDLAQRRRAVDRAAGGRRGGDRLCLSGLGMDQRRGRERRRTDDRIRCGGF